MTEFLQQDRKDNLQVDHMMADKAIASIVDSYEAQLTNGQLKAFRDLNDVSEKVNRVCYVYAADPELRTKAVNLRSWHTVRLISRQFQNIESGDEWSFMVCGLSASDDFDRQVYPTTEVFLKKVAALDMNLRPLTDMVTYDPEKNLREEVLFADENKAVLKREWCYSGTQTAHTAAFVVKAI